MNFNFYDNSKMECKTEHKIELDEIARLYVRTQIPVIKVFMEAFGENSSYGATYRNVAHWLRHEFNAVLEEAIKEAEKGKVI